MSAFTYQIKYYH